MLQDWLNEDIVDMASTWHAWHFPLSNAGWQLLVVVSLLIHRFGKLLCQASSLQSEVAHAC